MREGIPGTGNGMSKGRVARQPMSAMGKRLAQQASVGHEGLVLKFRT